MYDLIAFDADDTLWENNLLYLQMEERVKSMLAAYPGAESFSPALAKTESRNLQYFGYGVMSFVLSMVESAVQVTGGRVSADDLNAIVQIGKEMISGEVKLYPGVESTLRALAARYRMILITKGDLLHQMSKVERSGLKSCFVDVHVVVEKDRETYASILAKHGVTPERFLMVGDSMRSDILPVLELGGSAVYVPNGDTWSHERREKPAGFDGCLHEVEQFSQLADLLG
ncbi:MAG: HAD family hydrolase [Anaerolineaceae bacterium]